MASSVPLRLSSDATTISARSAPAALASPHTCVPPRYARARGAPGAGTKGARSSSCWRAFQACTGQARQEWAVRAGVARRFGHSAWHAACTSITPIYACDMPLRTEARRMHSFASSFDGCPGHQLQPAAAGDASAARRPPRPHLLQPLLGSGHQDEAPVLLGQGQRHGMPDALACARHYAPLACIRCRVGGRKGRVGRSDDARRVRWGEGGVGGVERVMRCMAHAAYWL